VFNLVRLPGNELSRDFSDCGNPCFNIGGRDGLFLESILDRAAEAKANLRARIDLQAQTYRGLKAINGVAVIRGASRSNSARAGAERCTSISQISVMACSAAVSDRRGMPRASAARSRASRSLRPRAGRAAVAAEENATGVEFGDHRAKAAHGGRR